VSGNTAITGEGEQRLADAALQLLDVARSVLPQDPGYRPGMPAEVMEAASMGLAIQAVFLAELIDARDKRTAEVVVTGERYLARFTGLGAGVGYCLAAGVGTMALRHALERVHLGMARALATMGLSPP
jgi:hypothetical protein